MIDKQVATAMRVARERSGKSPEQFARELARLTGGDLHGCDVMEMEAGGETVFANSLVAAAMIAEQPVSALLGELEMHETTIPQLQGRIARLERVLEERGFLPTTD